jgi:hypothetical protein
MKKLIPLLLLFLSCKSKTHNPPTQWKYSEYTEKKTNLRFNIAMCGEINKTDLASPDSISYTKDCSLIVQNFRDGTIGIALHLWQGLPPNQIASVRFDTSDLEHFELLSHTHEDSRYTYFGTPDSFLVKLKKANHVYVEFQLNGTRQVEFNVSGLEWPPKSQTIKNP